MMRLENIRLETTMKILSASKPFEVCHSEWNEESASDDTPDESFSNMFFCGEAKDSFMRNLGRLCLPLTFLATCCFIKLYRNGRPADPIAIGFISASFLL